MCDVGRLHACVDFPRNPSTPPCLRFDVDSAAKRLTVGEPLDLLANSVQDVLQRIRRRADGQT